MIFPGAFFIFSKFWFSEFLGGYIDKNSSKWQKFLSVVIYSAQYINNHISWWSFVVHKCKMIIHLGIFFIFSKFWFYGLLGESKSKTKSQNYKNLCPLHFISQEPYIIWPWFMVYICKRIIFAGTFYTFPNFNFPGQ